jgi:hypothetical protein
LNYKSLLHITLQLISSPQRAWEEIRLEEDRRRVLTDFVYPMIGLCGLTAFIGSLMTVGWNGPQSFQFAMTHCCAVLISLFGGYFLAAYIIREVCVRLLGRDTEMPLAQQFAGYALAVIFVLRAIIGLLPDFQIIGLLLQFYTLYVVWEGAVPMFQADEDRRMNFTLIATFCLIVCPIAIQVVFERLMVLLN